MEKSRIIVALDYTDATSALQFVQKIKPDTCRLKVGSVLFTSAGPDFIRKLVELGFDVFLDLKFHDIPSTVAQACRHAAQLGVWMINVHALGGRCMLEAAREAIDGPSHRPLLIAVTVLTSLSDEELSQIGLPLLITQVERLARLAASCDLDGVVCSAQEAVILKKACGREFKLVTPGIRLASPASTVPHSLDLVRPHQKFFDDQNRIMTPLAAIQSGADYLVIGRPITQSEDPVATLFALNTEIEKVTPWH